MRKEIENPYVHFLLEDDLITATYKKGKNITLDAAKEIVKMRRELTEDKPVVALLYNQGANVDKDARDYFVSDEGVKGITATAVILGNPFSSFILKIFVAITTPKGMHVKVFRNEEAAKKWLQQYRK